MPPELIDDVPDLVDALGEIEVKLPEEAVRSWSGRQRAQVWDYVTEVLRGCRPVRKPAVLG